MVIEDIIVKYLAGEAEAHEIAILEQWRKSSLENESHFAQMARLWEHANDRHMPKLNVDTAWNKVNTRIGAGKTGKVLPFYRTWYAVAAAIALFIGVALFLFRPKENGLQMLSAVNDGKNKLELALQDGSKITLLNGELDYPQQFDRNKRRVELKSGRAYFDIARDTTKKFEIQCGQSLVTVLGTEFEILYDGSQTTVSVNEGKVSFKTPSGERILTRGMKASYNPMDGTISALEGEKENDFAYATGVLRYENETLNKVVKDISQYSDHIDIEVDRAIVDCRISGKFNLNDGTKSVLEVVAYTVGAKLEMSEDGTKYRLIGGACQP